MSCYKAASNKAASYTAAVLALPVTEAASSPLYHFMIRHHHPNSHAFTVTSSAPAGHAQLPLCQEYTKMAKPASVQTISCNGTNDKIIIASEGAVCTAHVAHLGVIWVWCSTLLAAVMMTNHTCRRNTPTMNHSHKPLSLPLQLIVKVGVFVPGFMRLQLVHD